ncbi:MAG TPA: gamma-glutamyl-gamma-aminobutyrate hydrolase family protein [Thermoanaerobaculia bacterium]|jgi:putative glutamine amidotransferase|nr:gamma-glutamyl-gamma-aminobutyrate hydrolase family protein [Thermoanaerobaculia bacterium]
MILLTTSAEENAEPYIDALRAVGFRDDEISVLGPERRGEAGEFAARASGVLLTGGCDVEPSRYGEAVLPGGGVEILPKRDELEWGVLDAARELRLPVWGICRGLQVINVYFGGSLWQDLPSQLVSTVSHVPPDPETPLATLAHEVRVTALDSALGERLLPRGDGPVGVNSRHHQAVKALGAGLRPVALSPDDLIEAFDLDPAGSGDWWLRAVQWHPENLIELPVQRALWEDFAAAARRRAEEGS